MSGCESFRFTLLCSYFAFLQEKPLPEIDKKLRRNWGLSRPKINNNDPRQNFKLVLIKKNSVSNGETCQWTEACSELLFVSVHWQVSPFYNVVDFQFVLNFYKKAFISKLWHQSQNKNLMIRVWIVLRNLIIHLYGGR